MKTIRMITLTAFIGLMAGGVQAQMRINIIRGDEVLKTEPVDKVVFTAQYRATSVADTSHREKVEDEMMMLKVGEKTSVYYSYAKFLADSVTAAGRAAGLSMDALVEQMKNYQSRIDYKIYKNYPAGKVTTLDQLAMNRFRCEEVNESPAWELLSDTMTIMSYPCRKALCAFRGREYEAWFTTEIARSEGPWKLHGLPGLILKASDSRGEYVFECVALVQSRGEESIRFGAAGHESISRKNLNKQYERNAADPVGYATSSAPNVSIVIKGEDGQPRKAPLNTPYNPIELTEE